MASNFVDYIDPKINRRLGYKVPRSILLPPYLAYNPYFSDFTDAVDAIYGPTIDTKLDILANIRNMWVTNVGLENKSLNGLMLNNNDWSQPERELLVKQVNLLGMKLQTAGIVSDSSYQTIARFVGQYWFQKGTHAFIEFINFCLSSNLTSTNLWTQDYLNFFEVGSAAIGTPIWQGGTWYPTTHVTISASAGDLALVDLGTLTAFFYEIANYNLVLSNIDSKYSFLIVSNLGDKQANIVSIGAIGNTSVVVSNTFAYGVDAPLCTQTAGALPTTVMSVGAPDLTNGYFLGHPSSWISDFSNHKIPVYSFEGQQVTESPNVGSNIIQGQAGPPTLLFGPVGWIPVPGSNSSTARVPVFSTSSLTTTNLQNVSTQAIGVDRNCLLANPVGWTQLLPGLFTPYW